MPMPRISCIIHMGSMDVKPHTVNQSIFMHGRTTMSAAKIVRSYTTKSTWPTDLLHVETAISMTLNSTQSINPLKYALAGIAGAYLGGYLNIQ